MGKFNVCFRVAKSSSVSHAWIALHRCVEANARLSGESFHSIFARLEETHLFQRKLPSNWPTSTQIYAAADQLQKERNIWLHEYTERIEQRRKEKKAGQRECRDGRLREMLQKQGSYNPPIVGCWGWKKRRSSSH